MKLNGCHMVLFVDMAGLRKMLFGGTLEEIQSIRKWKTIHTKYTVYQVSACLGIPEMCMYSWILNSAEVRGGTTGYQTDM
jgi:hypothetical protein